MKILTWLVHDQVAGFNFEPRHGAQLADNLGAEVVIARSEAEFRERLATAEVALTWRFEQTWFAQAPRLRWLATPAAGQDYLAGLTPPHGLRISYGRFHGEFMAETVVGMMLAETRGLTAALRATDDWPRAEIGSRMVSLRGSHVVIVGYGQIGRWISRLLASFGVRITGLCRHPGAEARPVSELDSLLPGTDHLVLVLPVGADSRNLMDARRLALLPSHAVLYSVGRGHCVDETALAASLNQGRLRAAYLDVYQQEPLPAGSPLRRARNAVLLPHISAVAPQYLDRFVAELIEQLRAG